LAGAGAGRRRVTVVVRRGDRLDVPFLRSLLAFAYNWHVTHFETDISISHYVDGWGRKGDTSVVAMEDGHSVGAAWFRLFPEDSPGYGFLDAETPELTLVVVPTKQHLGIGEQLLDALVERARGEGYEALSVSVQRGDPDEERYIEHGFAEVREDGETLTLRRPL
jgi:GNAT superfamily N-acetyltransferase